MAGNQDYLEFLSDFVNGLNIHDQLPVPVSSYNIDDDELVGDFVHWLLQYLGQKHCPLGLVAPLIRSVVEEMLNYCKTDPEAHSLRDPSGQFSQLRLMQACMARANALCVRLHQDPALLARGLAPPPPHMVPVAAHGARSNQRRGMEDRHVVVHDFNAVFNVQDDTPASYYAVFDGHAGQDAAVFSVAHVHQFLAESPHYPADPVAALKDAILRTDKLYLKKVEFESRYQSGTTALCALLRGRMLHVAWVGDSQALLVRRGRAEMLVDPHKPKRPDEERRILALGGVVLFHGMWRVNGQLAVSRAIGDPNFKPYVSAEAEVRSVTLQGDEELLIMASDGLLDFVTPQQAASAAFQQIHDNPENINAVCSRLINLAKKQGSTDDISVIVAFLTDPHEIAKRPIPPAMDMDTEDLVDTNATHVNGSNNQWGNPFQLQEQQDSAAKKALNMDGINFDHPPVPVKQNGSGERGAGFNHQDLFDLGPETDVDRLDESDEDETGSQDGAGRNPFMCGIDDEEAELRRIQQQQPEFDVARHPREETPTPPADQVPEPESAATQDITPVVGDVENVAESGEDSEDEEWKYFSVEPSKQAAQTFDQLLPEQTGSEESAPPPEQPADTEELEFPTADNVSELLLAQKNNLQLAVDEEDPNMDSQLNPNAAEFVPVSPTMESCILPGAENPLGMAMDPFKADLVASTEASAPAFSESGFEHHPMDFLSSADMASDKENLVLQSSEADFDETLPSEHVFQQSAPTFEAEDLQQEPDQNFMNFCGAIPPVQVCELEPFSNDAVEETQFEENIEFEQNGMKPADNMDIFNNAPLSPVAETLSPVSKFQPDEELFAMEQIEEQADLLVETPNFSVAQSPTFPVVENIVTPDEESVASAATTSPAVEEQPFSLEMNEPAELPSSPLLPVQAMSPTPLSPQPFETKSFSPAPLSPIPVETKSFSPTPPSPIPVETKSFSPAPLSPIPVETKSFSPTPLSPISVETKSFSPTPLSPRPDEVMSMSPGPLSPQHVENMSFSPTPLSPRPDEAKSVSPIPLSPEPVVSPVPASPKQLSFPNEPEQVDITSPVAEVPPSLQESLPLSPVQDINLQEDMLSPLLENLVTDVSATPPPTPAMPLEDAMENKEEEKLSKVEVEALAQVVEKLSVASPEPIVEESQPETPSEPEPKPDLSTAEIATAALATAAIGTAAVAAIKSTKPTSPTKGEAPKKPASPTKEKLSSVTKKTPTSASKVAPKTTATTKAPVPAKTTTAAVKSAATKPAPSAAKAPAAAKKPASTSAPSAAAAKPKPTPSSATTRAPKPAPAAGATSPSKPLSARPKPPLATTTKPADAKKPLVNGDAAKTAPKRPVSAVTSTNAKPLAARPASAAPKPAGPAKLTTTSTTTAKTSPRPRPASAAVNGVAKPKPEVASKVASPRPASSSASSTTTARRVVAATKPAASTTTKQVKETANKQISATRTTKTVPPTRAAAAKTAAAAAAAAAAASAPATKVPPIRKPTSANKTTKAPPKESPNVEEVKVHMNGDSHPEVENGKDQIAGDGQQQEILLDVSSPCLIPVDAAAD